MFGLDGQGSCVTTSGTEIPGDLDVGMSFKDTLFVTYVPS